MASYRQMMDDDKQKTNLIWTLLLIVLSTFISQYIAALFVDKANNIDKESLTITLEPISLQINQNNKDIQQEVINRKQAILDHAEMDAARYEGISKMFKLIIEQQTETRADIKKIYLEMPKK